MNLKDAVEKAAKIAGNDYFLVSAFVELGKNAWTLMFYRQTDNTIIDFKVENDVEKGEVQDASFGEGFKKLDIDAINIEHLTALETAKASLKAKPTATYMSLTTKNGKAVWNISFILPDVSAAIYEIDAKTGAIVKQEKFSLFTKIK